MNPARTDNDVLSESELLRLLLKHRRVNWSGIPPLEMQEKIVDGLVYGDYSGPLRRIQPECSTQIVAAVSGLPLFGPLALWLVLRCARVTDGGCEWIVQKSPASGKP